MYWWILGLAAETGIALAYVGIAACIVLPMARSSQLTKNKLGVATAALFLTSAVHHCIHLLHAMTSVGVGGAGGTALPDAWGWDLALWDVVGAAVAAYYFGLRRSHGSLARSAQLFDDLRCREQHALELNDNVLQGLVVAKMALELDQRHTAVAALDTSIASASRMISGLLDTGERPVAGGLLRTSAAVLEPVAASSAAPGQSSTAGRR